MRQPEAGTARSFFTNRPLTTSTSTPTFGAVVLLRHGRHHLGPPGAATPALPFGLVARWRRRGPRPGFGASLPQLSAGGVLQPACCGPRQTLRAGGGWLVRRPCPVRIARVDITADTGTPPPKIRQQDPGWSAWSMFARPAECGPGGSALPAGDPPWPWPCAGLPANGWRCLPRTHLCGPWGVCWLGLGPPAAPAVAGHPGYASACSRHRTGTTGDPALECPHPCQLSRMNHVGLWAS